MSRLFALASCLVFLLACGQQTGECRRNRTDGAAAKNKTQDIDKYKDIEGASRIEGGLKQANVPPYLGTLWTRGPNGNDGRLAGTAIGLGGPHMLVHEDSLLSIHETPDQANPNIIKRIFPQSISKESHFSFPSPSRLDVNRPNLNLTDYKMHVASSIPGSPFKAVKIRSDITSPEYAAREPTFAAPVLEHDKSQFGTNCKGYGYSTRPESSRAGGGFRDFVSFSLQPPSNGAGKCDRGHCLLVSDNAAGCSEMSDHAMPVVCGKEEKLTYLIKKSDSNSAGDCNPIFEAYHVPHMIDDLRDIPGMNLRTG